MRGRAWGNALGGWRRQKRNARGQFSGPGMHSKLRKRGGGFVPYRRHGIGHNTFGLNAGAKVSRNRRISAGFYIRSESMAGQKKAMKIAKAQEHAQLGLSTLVPNSPGVETRGAKLRLVKRSQALALRKLTGGERHRASSSGVVGPSFSRVGTDRNSLPTYIVRYNSPKDRKKGSKNKRNKAIVAYNVRSVPGKRQYDWTQKPKKSRTQRRKKAAK